MYTIQDQFTFKLVTALFTKTLAMLQQLYDTSDMVMEFECPEFSWEVDEDEFGEMAVSLGVFGGFDFIGTWNGKTEPNEIEITINYNNLDLTKGDVLNRFVEMEQLVFGVIEKRLDEKYAAPQSTLKFVPLYPQE